MRILTIIIFTFLISSCAEVARVNTSSDLKLKESISVIRADLSTERRQEFNEAIKLYTLKEEDQRSYLNSLPRNEYEKILHDNLQEIDGLSADEIITAYKEIIKSRQLYDNLSAEDKIIYAASRNK